MTTYKSEITSVCRGNMLPDRYWCFDFVSWIEEEWKYMQRMANKLAKRPMVRMCNIDDEEEKSWITAAEILVGDGIHANLANNFLAISKIATPKRQDK